MPSWKPISRDTPYPEELMEPAASLSNDRWRHSSVADGQAERSIAISLKRIADALERNTTSE